MKRLFGFAVACLVAGAAHAAQVTVDFEEFSLGDAGGYLSPPLESKGYSIEGSVGLASAAVITATTTGTHAFGGTASGFGQDGFGVTTRVRFERTDGGVFAIHSLDAFLDTDVAGFTSLTGVTGGYSAVADLSVPVGTGDWLNLQYIEWHAEGNGFGFGYSTVEIDNLVVSAVPIPAAAWLFGSALAGLVWLRRAATV